MDTNSEVFDAVVVGASLGGCTAARLLGQRGLKVAVLDRVSDPRAYKKVCTHFIQASAVKTLERLGIAGALEAAGAVRTEVDICTRFGWIGHTIEEQALNVRRETLDPILRSAAAGTPGVDLRLGWAVKELLRDGERVVGVVAERDGQRAEIRAQVVVAADGRHSKLAEMAGVPATVVPNGRFLYASYWRLPGNETRSRIWFLDPDACYAFPNDGGLTVLVTMPVKERLPAFRADLEGSTRRMFAGLPRGPSLDAGERVGDFVGMLEMPNTIRRAAAKGIAFVGDAAMASDPLVGVGCGWALQSAEWLADDVGGALADRLEGRKCGRATCTPADRRGVDEALDLYARHHDERLRPHHEMINMGSKGTPFGLIDRLIFGAAAKDAAFASGFGRIMSRFDNPRDVVGPGLLLRAAWANVVGTVRDPAELPRS